MTREQILQEFPHCMLSLSFAIGEGQVQASTLRADPERTLDNIVGLLQILLPAPQGAPQMADQWAAFDQLVAHSGNPVLHYSGLLQMYHALQRPEGEQQITVAYPFRGEQYMTAQDMRLFILVYLRQRQVEASRFAHGMSATQAHPRFRWIGSIMPAEAVEDDETFWLMYA